MSSIDLPLALDALSLPLLLVDGERRVVAPNAAFCAWTGAGARRWIGLAVDELGLAGPALSAALDRCAAERQTQRLPQLAFQPKPDLELRADVICSAADPAGVAYLIEWHRAADLPETGRAAALPNALAATLKGLAHEVRNPLAGLRGAAQLLARRIHDVDARRYIEVIEAETHRLSDLVERLLDPHPSRPFAALNIHDVLERVRNLAEADAGWSARITRDYDPSLPELSGDRDRLIQAMLNLVRNALEAGANEVRLRSRAEHGVVIGETTHRLALRIDVIDDGRGIPEALAPRVLLPLVSGRAEGSGLGLALAQEIAREHGGGLSFVSRPGHTVFTLLLPYERANGDNAA
jgi:two-component system, NtrC family, nitrogen regulation sensor histidine kinase GlnL